MIMKTVSRSLSDGFIDVTYGLRTIGTQTPYFSVTALMWNNKAHARRWPQNAHSAGMLHNEVLRAFPDLADIVALHLSDINGVPMHAIANSSYYYERGELDKAANTLRVAVEDLPVNASREDFAAFANAQRARWADEARVVRVKYNLAADAE